MPHAQTRRVRNHEFFKSDFLPLVMDRLKIEPEALLVVVRNQPNNVYILARYDDEGEVSDFLIAYYPPGAQVVQLIQVDGQKYVLEFLDQLKKWTDEEARTAVEVIVDVDSAEDQFYTEQGFEPVKRVLSFALSRADEIIEDEGDKPDNSTTEVTDGTATSGTSGTRGGLGSQLPGQQAGTAEPVDVGPGVDTGGPEPSGVEPVVSGTQVSDGPA